MGIVLGPNRYGKAEVRLVRVDRADAVHHALTDLNVSVSLSGDLAATHLRGDNTNVLPTDTMRAIVYSFAREEPVAEIEAFALRLARHFTSAYEPVDTARVRIHAYPWERIAGAEGPHPHAWTRAAGTRYAGAVSGPDGAVQVVSGVEDLTVLKSTGSAFHGFLTDRYTTLQPTDDRILATAVTARWRHTEAGSADWTGSYTRARDTLLRVFAETPSLALQQSLYAMGEAVLADQEALAEVRLALPNKHHFEVDLTPYGQDNPGVVYYAADRPYGLIEGTALRTGTPPAHADLPW
ncbi:factor-independent urate hydroxylase [Yinghuangia seranimata]|uniref:factor-independent urate hydroxylase n=1 Tax=Yinghuangia seranimata TaxID=408067 RepID=UPI00248BC507|nr:urate oxidase [Yinghuangia seranimata]MDI2126082.1 urate oxidase [Yinghuangia seranimata]